MTDDRSTKIMTAIFRDRDAAERAYGALTDRGYTSKDVNLLMSKETRERCFPRTERTTTELGSKASEGAGIGAVAGGGLGALLAGMAASGIAVPLLPIIALGPLAAALAGAGTGGAVGAVIGALVGAGIPEERAKLYDEGIKEGGIVLGVTPVRGLSRGRVDEGGRGSDLSAGRRADPEGPMNSARAAATIFASLVLAAGTFGAQSSGADEMMGRHSMEGKITSVDAKKGWVHVKTQDGTMIVHFPPAALQGVKKGDTINVDLAIKDNGPEPAKGQR